MSDVNKLPDQSIDPELDKLLDSALADFEKLSHQSEEKEDPPVTSTSEVDENLSEINLDETWSQDFIKQTAEKFEKDFQGLMQNGDSSDFESSLQKMAQTVASAISSSSTADNSGEGNEFHAAIAQALKDISATSENLQNSSSGITEADLAAMLGGASDESGCDILPFMQGMMQSLLSKEILYPSLKELMDKYPAWLNEKKETLSTEDFERFNKQFDLIQKVCTELEVEKDDDTSNVKKKRFEKILGLMQSMQSCGQPPEELIGDQTGIFQLDNEGNPRLPSGVDPQNCNIM